MNSFRQVIADIYVALAEAAGGPAALRRANQVLRDAIKDGAVDDPTAIMLLESLAHDEDDEGASEIVAPAFDDVRMFDELAPVH
jgi:hypothetical protein